LSFAILHSTSLAQMSQTPSSSTAGRAGPQRHNPLADDLSPIAHLRTKATISTTGKRKSRSYEESGDGYVDALSSRKILAIAQDLAEEDAAERDRTRVANAPNAAFAFDSRIGVDVGHDERDRIEDYEDNEGDWMPEEDVEEEDVDPGDLAIYKKFLSQDESIVAFAPSLAALYTNGQAQDQGRQNTQDGGDSSSQTTNLADLILQRIAEKEALDQHKEHLQTSGNNTKPDSTSEIPPRVVEAFTKCGQLLSRYKSGPLPKPFKILPTLPSWPDLLAITQPESWTPNAVFAATKIFISAQPAVAQHYLNTVLLDRVKEEIYGTKKLNVHLYNSLKKALYRPAAFFKGFLFPLVSENCTLREANIISSVLVRISIPVLHSAAALLRLCEIAAGQSMTVNTESAGACNIFIRVLLEKKYALPYKAVDALVFHFLRFRNSSPAARGEDTEMSEARKSVKQAGKDDKLPVLWHQCLLVFAQRYKNDITEDQREALLDLLLVRGHKDIGPEIRRELLVGRGRGAVQEPGGQAGDGGQGAVGDDGDDTMRDVGVKS
jgi:essential nuclear protein 1